MFDRAIHCYELDGDAVLLDGRTAQLFVLNSTASFVWQHLDGGGSASEAAALLSLSVGIPLSRASADVMSVLAQWERNGLIGTARVKLPDAAPLPGLHEPSASVPKNTARHRDARKVYRACRLLDFSFVLSADEDLEDLVDIVVGHLAVSDQPERAEWPHWEISTNSRQRRLSLVADGRELASCSSREEIAPMLHANIYLTAYRHSACLVALHAAAVLKDSRCIVIPGSSGSGKSVLSAALVANGFSYCTDDLAILTTEPVRLRPLPLRLALKEGAWSALTASFPEIPRAPTHRRADGRLVKYLLPREDRLPPLGSMLPVVAIVFPKYVAASRCTLQSISRSDALNRIASGGYDVPGELTPARVEAMIGWLRSLSCYELTFDDLEGAVAAVAGIMD